MNEQSYELNNIKIKVHSKKKNVFFFLISAILCIAIGFGAGFIVFRGTGKINATSAKLKEVDNLVKNNYIGELDYDKIDSAVLSAYMEAIEDKYSFYKSTEDAEAVSDSLEGDIYGIGVTVFYNKKAKGLQIIRLDNSGPANKADLKIGDIITEIDGTSVAKLGYNKSINAIKREIGETVKLKVLRNDSYSEYTLTYEKFVKQSVYYHKIENTGYICFTSFNASTVTQFNEALNDLLSQNITGLLFDLRDNGGGTVDSVLEILDTLLPECNLMWVKYLNGDKKLIKKSDSKKVALPMAVIVNENTASASELFSAALRDIKNAPLIGSKTYGKGVMQRTYFLTDNSCIRFTVGKFYPPTGECFDGEGLEPDFQITYTENQQENYYTLGDNDPAITQGIKSLSE